MRDHMTRIRRLEQQSAAGDGAMLAALLRRANREGDIGAAVKSLELKRPLDSAFRQRAERTWNSVQDLARALFQVTP